MKNKVFSNMTDSQRKQKLVGILRERSHSTLSPDEIRWILRSVNIRHQHNVITHTEVSSFERVLNLRRRGDRNDRGSIIFGMAVFGINEIGELLSTTKSAAAVVTKKQDVSESVRFTNTIHLYIPHSQQKRRR